MNYFVPGLNHDKLERIRAAQISFCKHTLTSHWFPTFLPNEEGILISERDFLRACEVLGAEIDKEKCYSREGITRASLRFSKRPAPVVLADADSKFEVSMETAFFQIASEILLPSLNRDVVISRHNGQPFAPKQEKLYHLRIHCSPEAGRTALAPSSIFGFPVTFREGSSTASKLGTILYDDNSTEIGEIVGDNFYLFHNGMVTGNSAELSVFRKFCEEIVAALTLPSDERMMRSERLAAEAEKRRRKLYLQLSTERLEEDLLTTEQQIERTARELLQLEQAMREKTHQHRLLELKRDAIEQRRQSDYPRLIQEYLRLKEDPKILHIEPQDGILRVWTDTLYCQDRTTLFWHEIGKMRIELAPDGDQEMIRIFNLSRTCKGHEPRMPHPHVRPDGSLCFGQSRQRFNELLIAHELAATVFLAIQFIETVNVHDLWGKHIVNWPVVPESEVRRLRAHHKLPAAPRSLGSTEEGVAS